ncbi:hypothetical protein MMC34_005964 [Xylographa carneopallida]|nr:hypothetical protein [Xylographa carneopallida]
MLLFSDFVTPLEDRVPIPGWFVPGFIILGMLSTLPPPEYRYLRIALSGSVLLAMLLRAPKYTSGNVNPDFVSGLITSGITLKWWEFVVYRQAEQEFWRIPSWLEKKPPKANGMPHEGNGHAIEGNGHAIEGNGHATQGNGHATEGTGNGHAIKVNGHAIEGNGKATKGNGHTVEGNGHIVEGNGRVIEENGKHEDLQHKELKRTATVTHGEFGTWQEKLRWTVGLWSTTRGVEWNYGIKNLQRTSPDNLTRL